MNDEATEKENGEDLDELSSDEIEDEEDAASSTDEIDDNPEIETVQKRGKVFHLCPYPDCNFDSEKLAALLGHIKFRHKTRGQYLTKNGKVIKGEKLIFDTPMNREIAARTKSKSKPKSSASKGASKMAKSSEEADPVDIGLKSKVKGKLRRLLKLIAQADPEQRDILMPEREQIMDFVKILNKATTSSDDIIDIENHYEDEIKPAVETVLEISISREPGEKEKPAPISEEMAGLTRTAKLRGKVKMSLTSLAKLPPSKKDELVAERETLVMLNRRLGGKNIPQEELDEMEAVFETEVRPNLDAAIQSSKKVPVKPKDGGDSVTGMTLDHKREELEMARVNRLLTEEKVRERELRESMKSNSAAQHGGSWVPIRRPKFDDNGQPVRDDDGGVVMEETYVPVEQARGTQDLLMALLMSGRLGGGNDNNQIITAMMNNNTTLLTTLLANKNDGASDKEIILQVQNENMKMMMQMQQQFAEMMKSKGEDPQMGMLREEIRAARDAQQQTQNQMHQQQLGFMQREMEDLKRYAYRDDLETLLGQKEKLEKLGVVNPAAKDAETKALEESTKLAKEALDKADDIGKEVRSFVQPFADAQAEIMRTQAGMNRPLRKAMTEQEKTKKYKQLLDAIESEEEEQ